MKKLTIRNVATHVTYSGLKEVDGIMTVTSKTQVLPGKMSQRDVKKHMENVTHLTGTVESEVVKDVYRIPYNVLEELINYYSINNHIFDDDIFDKAEETERLILGKNITYRAYTSPLGIPAVSIVENIEAIEEDELIADITAIVLPKAVFDYIITEYRIEG